MCDVSLKRLHILLDLYNNLFTDLRHAGGHNCRVAVEGGEGGDQAQAMPSVFETLKSVARLIDMEGALP